jgi:hypothetical protein
MTHIFIFRHCIRSTKSKVNLYDGDGKQKGKSFFKAKLPRWNTPDEWCTEEGVGILRRTGVWLAQQYYMGSIASVRVVSDTSQRDVDSALSLTQGLRDVAGKNVVTSVELNPSLFHPMKNTSGPVCKPVAEQVRAQQIQKRLYSIPQPTPSLVDTLELIDSLAHLKRTFPDANSIEVNVTKAELKGPVNLVKYFAQMLLYSRVSNLKFPLGKKKKKGVEILGDQPTIDQMQQLLQWIGWQRSVVEISNSLAAQRGAVVVNFLLDNLNVKEQKIDDEQVLILFGHDSTMDALATTFNMSWILPFYGHYSPTPPGSAMHFYDDNENGEVRVELLYPTDFGKNGTVNNTGVLERLPLASFRSVQDLKRQAVGQLEQYPGALECFEKVAGEQLHSSTRGEDYDFLGIGIMLVTTVMLLLVFRDRIIRWKGQLLHRSGQQQAYHRVQIELT